MEFGAVAVLDQRQLERVSRILPVQEGEADNGDNDDDDVNAHPKIIIFPVSVHAEENTKDRQYCNGSLLTRKPPPMT